MTTELLSKEEFNQRLDALRHTQFDVLSDGHVALVDCMGTDQDIVDAARISYGAGTRRTSADRHLIRYLMRHHHTTPFEMVELKFRVRVPMDTWRQWIRHRTASVNEYSTRYSEAIDSKDDTGPEGWRQQSDRNRQGSEVGELGWPEGWSKPEYLDPDTFDATTPGGYLTQREAAFHRVSREIYDERLQFGIAREQARKDLPLSTYTEAYWKCNLHNLLHFLRLRMDSHAQKEIRDYATIIGEEIVSKLVPVTWEAFQDYRLNAMSLTGPELAQLNQFIAQCVQALPLFISPDTAYSALVPEWQVRRSRERQEFMLKLVRLGLVDSDFPEELEKHVQRIHGNRETAV